MRYGIGILLIMLGFVLAFAAPSGAGDGALPQAKDLRADAKAAQRKQVPVVLMFDATYCGSCRTAREDHLRPMYERGSFDHRAIFRVVTIDRNEQLMDFDGEPVGRMEFAERYNGTFTPTIVFLNPEGEEVAEPVQGLRIPEFYERYLNRGVETALDALQEEDRRQAAR